MKKRNAWIAGMLLLAGSFSFDLMAQESLDALIKKCETIETIDINIVRNKDPKTKTKTRSIVNITIPARTNQTLIDEFVAAFKKEKDNTVREIENRKGGKVVNLHYQFEKKVYTFNLGYDDGNAHVSIIDHEGDKDD